MSREQFEKWYAENAFDFVTNPIGSRECGLQWAAFQAGHAAGLEAAAQEAERYLNYSPSYRAGPMAIQAIRAMKGDVK